MAYLSGIVTMLTEIAINLEIADRYRTATGKDRAFFSLIEISYYYKYFFAATAVFAILASRSALERGASRRQFLITFLIALLSLLSVFARMWRLWV